MANEKAKDSIILYFDWLDHLSLLSAADGMAVLFAIRDYVSTGQAPTMAGASAMAFSFIKAQVDRDLNKWEDTRKKRSAAGRIGAAVTNNGRQNSANSATADCDDDNAANSAVNVPAPVNVPVPVPVNVPVPNSVGIIKADKPPRTRFSPPSVDEVRAYCGERKNGVDPQHFIDYYTARGWRLNNGPMKDWKAAVRTWERNEKNKMVDTRNEVKGPEDYSGGDFLDELFGGGQNLPAERCAR